MLKEYKLVKNSTTPWLCFRDPRSKLVYFVHSKCACTFYKQLFQKLEWQKTTTNEIDWDTNIVFSYIKDPLKKHRGGIIQWFYHNNKIDILENNANNMDFFDMLSRIAYLDHHSLSIYEHLGENSKLVRWIPIDYPLIDHKQRTIELLEQYSTVDSDTKAWFEDLTPKNVSLGFKKKCVDILMELPVDPLITKSIEYDRFLYDSVTKKNFEPASYSRRIDYLKKQGMTQAQAEAHADTDVETGNYINWN